MAASGKSSGARGAGAASGRAMLPDQSISDRLKALDAQLEGMAQQESPAVEAAVKVTETLETTLLISLRPEKHREKHRALGDIGELSTAHGGAKSIHEGHSACVVCLNARALEWRGWGGRAVRLECLRAVANVDGRRDDEGEIATVNS